MHNLLSWDEWYTSFVHRARFLPLAHLISGGLPMMDSAALMALVDWWRPETHTFHLPCGKATVTLQDIAMIFGLPIDGTLVSGMVSPGGWSDSIGAAISHRPPPPSDVLTDQKDKKTTNVHSGCLIAHFDTCSEDAEGAVI
jgi:hypothetical protein